jgi:hypothetical protein
MEEREEEEEEEEGVHTMVMREDFIGTACARLMTSSTDTALSAPRTWRRASWLLVARATAAPRSESSGAASKMWTCRCGW